MNHVITSAILLSCAFSVSAAEPLGKREVIGTPHRLLVADSDKRLIAILSATGEVEWSRPLANEVHQARMLPNGHVLYAEINNRIIEVDPKTDKEVWTYDSRKQNGNEGKRVEVHDFMRQVDGSTVIFESGSARIIEVDVDGKLLKQVPLTVDHPDSHRDTRNACKIANDHYLVAHEGDNKVREYDSAGAVVWSYDVKSKVYGVLRLANGNTLINSGDGHRAFEVDHDGKEVWSIGAKDLPGITLAWLTQIERLPNGNTIIVNCHAGPTNPQIIEVTRDKQVVWSFRDFERFGNSMAVASILDAPEGTIR